MLRSDQLLLDQIRGIMLTDVSRKLTLSQAVNEFFIAKRVERLSPNTIKDYGHTLSRFMSIVGEDTPFEMIEAGRVRSFLADMTTSNKTVLNAYVALSSLWTWAIGEGICTDHIMRRIKAPVPEQRVIKPLTYDETKRILEIATVRCPERNRAIIMLLLDTGIRATELCTLTIGDIQGDSILVLGKGNKEREIPLSPRTLRVLLDYLSIRRKAANKSPLFIVKGGKPLNRQTLLKWLNRVGERASISGVHPHRFRHTFAVNYLRNGGDALSLQRILGHSTLDMVKRYVEFAAADVTAIHRRASPVQNWDL